MNNINLRRVKTTENMSPELKYIYLDSFPENERRPWNNIISRVAADDPFFTLYQILNGNEIIGLITTWNLPGILYIEHFAISENARGMGYGSATLEHIKSIADQRPVVLEVELPDSSIDSNRRIQFYKKNGFKALEDFPYFQPAYLPGEDIVPMMLMTSHEINDLKSFVIMLHTVVYNQ